MINYDLKKIKAIISKRPIEGVRNAMEEVLNGLNEASKIFNKEIRPTMDKALKL